MRSQAISWLAYLLTFIVGGVVWFFVMATTGSHMAAMAATGLTGVIGGVTDARRVRNEQQ